MSCVLNGFNCFPEGRLSVVLELYEPTGEWKVEVGELDRLSV